MRPATTALPQTNATDEPTTTIAPTTTTSPAVLDVHDAARYCALSPAYLAKARLRGDGPEFLRLGRTIRYRVVDLDSWLATKLVTRNRLTNTNGGGR